MILLDKGMMNNSCDTLAAHDTNSWVLMGAEES